MCWNAPVSFVTFFGGSLLNLLCYFLLGRTNLSRILIYWQYTLLMQLIEGIIWLRYDTGSNIQMHSLIAMVLNVTQPFVLLLVVKYGIGTTVSYAIVANIMYAALLLSEPIWDFRDIAPPPGCVHLELRYWNISTTTSYMLASVAGFLEIPDRVWAAANIVIFVGSLLLAMLISSCGRGSLFCWLIFASGGILVLVDYLRRIKIVWKRGPD